MKFSRRCPRCRGGFEGDLYLAAEQLVDEDGDLRFGVEVAGIVGVGTVAGVAPAGEQLFTLPGRGDVQLHAVHAHAPHVGGLVEKAAERGAKGEVVDAEQGRGGGERGEVSA